MNGRARPRDSSPRQERWSLSDWFRSHPAAEGSPRARRQQPLGKERGLTTERRSLREGRGEWRLTGQRGGCSASAPTSPELNPAQRAGQTPARTGSLAAALPPAPLQEAGPGGLGSGPSPWALQVGTLGPLLGFRTRCLRPLGGRRRQLPGGCCCGLPLSGPKTPHPAAPQLFLSSGDLREGLRGDFGV